MPIESVSSIHEMEFVSFLDISMCMDKQIGLLMAASESDLLIQNVVSSAADFNIDEWLMNIRDACFVVVATVSCRYRLRACVTVRL